MSWKEMEAFASKLTADRNKKKKEIEEKLEALRKFNLEHPITVTKIVYQSEPKPALEIEVDPITYNPAWYVLNYLAPDRNKKKKK